MAIPSRSRIPDLLLAFTLSLHTVPGQAVAQPICEEPSTKAVRGIASWYGRDFHGKRTASSERFNMHAFTAANMRLPFGTVLRVENVDNGKMVNVKVNDRGPFHRGRIIDLSKAAAQAIDLTDTGTAKVRIQVCENTLDI